MTDLTAAAVVAHDAGAANIIFAWFAPDAPPRCAYVEGPALAAWRKRFGDAPIAPTLEDAVECGEYLLTGSGWSSDLEHRARAMAASHRQRSVAVIDHWTHYRERFERDGTTALPDEIWVSDGYARDIATRAFPGIPVQQRRNAYLDEQIAAAGTLPANGSVLWIGEPARSHWGRDESGEFQALDYFVAHRNRLGIANDVPTVLRPHPSEPVDKYDDWIARHTGWSCDADGNLWDALRQARWVVGLESAALAVALASGREAISALPEWAPACRLPHDDIVHLKDLVANMKYCHRCLQADTRPNTRFDDDGICPACTYWDLMGDVDWDERKDIILDIADRYRNPSAQYDCIIGVSGGKDSTRQAMWVRDYLKLRPLLVCLSYPPEQVSQKGVDNLSNLIEQGFDLIQSAPAPETWRKLMGLAFDQYVNWCKATELALFSSVPQIAIAYKIPLILWGENPGLQLGDLGTLGSTGYDGNNLRNMNTLAGGDNQWMFDAGFSAKDLIPYDYPSVEAFERHNIQIVYLGWFLGDWSLKNNGAVSALAGLHIRDDIAANTGDLYGVTSLDEDWVTLNQMIKYYKYGFGRASDYVNELIRRGDITRQRGIELAEQYDGACSDKYIEDFCAFIGIAPSEFWQRVRDVTNRDLFTIDGNRITPKFKVGQGLPA